MILTQCRLTYRIVVGALMLRPIGAVAERLRAAIVLAAVRPLACVRSLVYLQVLQARECLVAAAKLPNGGRVKYASQYSYLARVISRQNRLSGGVINRETHERKTDANTNHMWPRARTDRPTDRPTGKHTFNEARLVSNDDLSPISYILCAHDM